MVAFSYGFAAAVGRIDNDSFPVTVVDSIIETERGKIR